MEQSIPTILIAAALALTPALTLASPPDLCAERVRAADGSTYHDVTGFEISRWCEPHTDPPVWAAPLCCVVTDEANCVAPTPGSRCHTGMMFWCEYGERVGDGVACYQPAPDACEMGFCSEVENPNGMTVFEDTVWLCCDNIADELECIFATTTGIGELPQNNSCGGFLAACEWGVSNLDGTVECFDVL